MTDVIDFKDPGEVPALDWIDKGLIDIDPAYQRGLDEARAQKIALGFAWDTFGAVVVAPKEGGRYSIIDGQHRLAAAKLHPMVSVVPAIVIAAIGTAAEAGSFVGINADRKNVSALDLFWAMLAAEDEDALTVSQVVARAGVTICRHPASAYKPAETIAVSAIRSVVDNRGALRSRTILEVLAKAGSAPITGTQVRAAELLLTDDEFRHEVDAEVLVDSLSGNEEAIAVEAKAFAKTHRMTAARAFASVWFRRTRKRRKAA